MALEKAMQQRAGALVVGADAYFSNRRDLLIGPAARHSIPAIYAQRELADRGGLMSYGPNNAETFFQTGIYAG